MLTLLLLTFVTAVLAAILIFVLLKLKLVSHAAVPASGTYELRQSLFTPAERSFAGVLDSAMPDGVTWFGKVRLGDVFRARRGLTASQNATARNRIDRKHIDFLLVRSTDLAPIAGIELDDSSHQREDRKQRDAFVDELFRSCGVPILHIPVRAAYNQLELQTAIANTLRTSSTVAMQ